MSKQGGYKTGANYRYYTLGREFISACSGNLAAVLKTDKTCGAYKSLQTGRVMPKRTDVDNVANVDFLLNLFDCSLARVQTHANLPRHFAFASPVAIHKILQDF